MHRQPTETKVKALRFPATEKVEEILNQVLHQLRLSANVALREPIISVYLFSPESKQQEFLLPILQTHGIYPL